MEIFSNNHANRRFLQVSEFINKNKMKRLSFCRKLPMFLIVAYYHEQLGRNELKGGDHCFEGKSVLDCEPIGVVVKVSKYGFAVLLLPFSDLLSPSLELPVRVIGGE